jgi:hypothetical protein
MNFVIQRWIFLGARRKYWKLPLVFCTLAALLPFIPYALGADVLSLIFSALAQGASFVHR